MAERTIKFYGNAFAETGNVSIVMNYNGVEVYNGAVATSTDEATVVADMIELLSFASDTDVTGNVPVSITVTGGTLAVQRVEGNHNILPGVYNPSRTVTETDTDYTDFAPLHQGFEDKNSIHVNGAAIETDNSYAGSWVILVPDNGTIEYNVVVDEVQSPPA